MREQGNLILINKYYFKLIFYISHWVHAEKPK